LSFETDEPRRPRVLPRGPSHATEANTGRNCQTMGLNQAELERLDHQTEFDRDREYVHTTKLMFDFDDARCDNSFESHLSVIARLCERLAGADAASKIDLSTRPAPQRTAWAVLDDHGRGLMFHHDKLVQGQPKDEGEFIDIFWSTVGLPDAFAVCYDFGRYFLDDGYDLYLTPSVEVTSNLPEEQHSAALREFTESMLALGFPRVK
jgi:hypothetical protein